MMVWLRRIGFFFALSFLVLTVINASWLADRPRGYVRQIAHHGTAQQFDHQNLAARGCSAAHIETPVHDYLANTIDGLMAAVRLGAPMIEVDVSSTSDGQLVLFGDDTLDCATNGKGIVNSHTLAELKALDLGYGYTADGGKSFPFRGKGLGLMPTVAQALRVLPTSAILFNVKSSDPQVADRLAALIKAAGRNVDTYGDGFTGPAPLIARLHAAFPKAWAFSPESVSQCTSDYLKYGWFTVVPESCKGGTLRIPLNYQWAFAGWPDRTQQRMKDAGARIIITGPYHFGKAAVGLDLPEQIPKVPAAFTGYLWVEDIYTVGPALHPGFNKRRPPEEEALIKALAARRKARE